MLALRPCPTGASERGRGWRRARRSRTRCGRQSWQPARSVRVGLREPRPRRRAGTGVAAQVWAPPLLLAPHVRREADALPRPIDDRKLRREELSANDAENVVVGSRFGDKDVAGLSVDRPI